MNVDEEWIWVFLCLKVMIVYGIVCKLYNIKQVRMVRCVRPFLGNDVSFLKASLKNDQK